IARAKCSKAASSYIVLGLICEHTQKAHPLGTAVLSSSSNESTVGREADMLLGERSMGLVAPPFTPVADARLSIIIEQLCAINRSSHPAGRKLGYTMSCRSKNIYSIHCLCNGLYAGLRQMQLQRELHYGTMLARAKFARQRENLNSSRPSARRDFVNVRILMVFVALKASCERSRDIDKIPRCISPRHRIDSY
ncbi:hypothetical protein ALC62_15920, partial [Cyphomyrmex costatus]